MKIRQEHLAVLKSAIDSCLAKYPDVQAEYESGDFARSDKVKDIQRRFCFDIMHGAGLTKFVCDELYPYMNDDHLYTALKTVCPTVTKRF